MVTQCALFGQLGLRLAGVYADNDLSAFTGTEIIGVRSVGRLLRKWRVLSGIVPSEHG